MTVIQEKKGMEQLLFLFVGTEDLIQQFLMTKLNPCRSEHLSLPISLGVLLHSFVTTFANPLNNCKALFNHPPNTAKLHPSTFNVETTCIDLLKIGLHQTPFGHLAAISNACRTMLQVISSQISS
ncbi:hypothetical protein DPEC_G00223880 [Dallia pectoralis]|uniref:Uncharacterized protein n=1 Tax=Dallia pectoralis TaxID=75939 RepID=A0ACC2FZQ5_DALPE|nr:hypothetical protein DPEC_G00223880 [Dallia pectoralis]